MKIKNLARAAAGAALGLTLAFGTAVPALAASITINGAANGETYNAYKLFDLTKNASGGYAYSIASNETELMELISGATDSEGTSLGISFTASADGSRYTVSGITDDNVAAFASYLNNNISALGVADGTATASGNTVTIDDLDEGYYFVDTTLGSLCIINSSGETDINEKNSVPSVTKKVKEDSTDTFGEKATVDVTDTVYYQLTVNTGTNSNGIGTGVDGNYVIVDQLPDGITYNEGSVAIEGWSSDTDYTVSYNSEDNALTIKLLSTGKLGTLGQNQDVVITYNAAPSDTLVVDTAHTNTVTLTYKNKTMTDEAVVKTYDIAKGGVVKVDQDGEALAGVKFVLSKNEKGVTKYAVIENNYLKQWVGTQSDATELTTDESGHIYVNGLDADTYILTETATLDGYNLLNDTITVVIAEDGSVSYKLTNSESEAGPSIEVENHTGQELPTTGGMGTTALYIVGGVLVAGAGITLVVRRRMSAEA